MMTQSFYTGLSGLLSNDKAISVVSDNIANVSTVGFKSYNAEQSSLFEKSLAEINTNQSSTDSTIGIGTKVSTISMDTSYGSLENTDRSTDLALYGDGWFGLQNGSETLYTRAGNFTFDQNNDLVTPDGYHVLGSLGSNVNANGELTEILNDIPLGAESSQEKLTFNKELTYPPKPTTKASFNANIGTDATVRALSANVIDANGEKTALRLKFTKKEVQNPPGSQWDIVATTQSSDGKTIYDTKNGAINFDEQGGLISTTLTNINNNGSNIDIDLGQGFGGVVSTNAKVTVNTGTADGTVGGELAGYTVNKNAEVIATFTNGLQSSVGKIAVYHFQNDQGLTRAGSNTYVQSNNSGEPQFFRDADGNYIHGTDITNHALEGSNVKMEVAMTELIALQRYYQSNAQVVTTADELIKKALDM